jgi:DTW domain-containing protein YfiP
MTADYRPVCPRCRRPEAACWCAHLPRLEAATRVVFLQHPRERRVAISTCRMAHLALPGSVLLRGVRFDEDARLEALCRPRRPDGLVAVLFPGEGALDPRDLPPGAVDTLIVADGTWPQAKKLVRRSALLAGLPRMGLAPSRPSAYRIRREPAEHCVSTIEAVVEVLGLLEGDEARFRPALAAFDHMIDYQLRRHAERTEPSRYGRKKRRAAAIDPAASSGTLAGTTRSERPT